MTQPSKINRRVSSGGTHFDPEIVKVFVELKEDFRAIRDEMKD